MKEELNSASEKHRVEIPHVAKLTENEKNFLLENVENLTFILKGTDPRFPTVFRIDIPSSFAMKADKFEEAVTVTKKEIIQQLNAIRNITRFTIIDTLESAIKREETETFLKTQTKELDRNDRGEPTYLKICDIENSDITIEYEFVTGHIWFTRSSQINGEKPDHILQKTEVEVFDKVADTLFKDPNGTSHEKRFVLAEILEMWKEADAFFCERGFMHQLQTIGRR